VRQVRRVCQSAQDTFHVPITDHTKQIVPAAADVIDVEQAGATMRTSRRSRRLRSSSGSSRRSSPIEPKQIEGVNDAVADQAEHVWQRQTAVPAISLPSRRDGASRARHPRSRRCWTRTGSGGNGCSDGINHSAPSRALHPSPAAEACAVSTHAHVDGRDDGEVVPVGRWRFYAYFLRLGATGFGGPIALAGFMQRDLVDARRWISREDYRDGLALAQLAPGPLAAQLAMYLGYVRAGTLGATIVSVCFILPSFLMVWALSVAYVRYGGLPWMQGLFYGIGAAVIGIISRSALKLTTLTLGRSVGLWSIFGLMALTTAWTQREIPWLFVLAGVVTAVMAWWRSPQIDSRLNGAGLLALAIPAAATPLLPSLPNIFYLFAQAGAFVFGSGLAIVPFLYGELVQTHRWLNDRQFLDAVAVAMITPGPVVITVAFIGYLVSGPSGMATAALGVFLPVYLFVVLPAPYFRRHRSQPTLKAFVEGVSAAATGAIAGAAWVLGTRALVDVATTSIAVATFLILIRWKLSELWLIAGAALWGLLAS
jgi:chromate transporter